MAGPYDPKDVILYVDTETGTGSIASPTATLLLDMTGYAFEDGNEGDITTWVFGRANPHRRGGSPEQSYSLNGLLNWSDPGQIILRDAREDGSTVYITEVYPDGAALEISGKVTEAPHNADADGDWAENAFTIAIEGTIPTAPTT